MISQEPLIYPRRLSHSKSGVTCNSPLSSSYKQSVHLLTKRYNRARMRVVGRKVKYYQVGA
jgi:hypothetical protein